MRLKQKLCWHVAVAIWYWMLKTFCCRLAPHVYHIAKNVSLYLVINFIIIEVWRLLDLGVRLGSHCSKTHQ